MQGEVTKCTLESHELISGKTSVGQSDNRQFSEIKLASRAGEQTAREAGFSPPPRPPTCQRSGLKNWSVARAGGLAETRRHSRGLLHHSQLLR